MLLHFRHSVKLMWMHECLTDIIAVGGLLGGLRLACYCWKRGSRVQIAERYRILLEVIESVSKFNRCLLLITATFRTLALFVALLHRYCSYRNNGLHGVPKSITPNSWR